MIIFEVLKFWNHFQFSIVTKFDGRPQNKWCCTLTRVFLLMGRVTYYPRKRAWLHVSFDCDSLRSVWRKALFQKCMNSSFVWKAKMRNLPKFSRKSMNLTSKVNPRSHDMPALFCAVRFSSSLFIFLNFSRDRRSLVFVSLCPFPCLWQSWTLFKCQWVSTQLLLKKLLLKKSTELCKWYEHMKTHEKWTWKHMNTWKMVSTQLSTQYHGM